MKRYQVEVEYILDQIETAAIVDYVAHDPSAIEDLLGTIDTDDALKYLMKYANTDTVLDMMDFNEIEKYYLASK